MFYLLHKNDYFLMSFQGEVNNDFVISEKYDFLPQLHCPCIDKTFVIHFTYIICMKFSYLCRFSFLLYVRYCLPSHLKSK